MRHTLPYILLALLLMLTACNAHRRHSLEHASESTANLTLTVTQNSLSEGMSDTLQLGRMRQGEVIMQRIRLINGDAQPMVILRDGTSCGCTTATYTRKPFAAGSSCDIELEFDSRSQSGWQMKLMEFYFAHSDKPLKIYIDAEVE